MLNFKIIFALRIFKNIVAYMFFHQVFTFIFHCSMPSQSPERNIWILADQVKYIAVSKPVRLWDHGHYGYLWVHPSAVINIPPGSSNINTIIQTTNGEVVLVIVSHSGCLLEMDCGWLNSVVCPIICVDPGYVRNTYRPSYLSSRQQDFGWLFRSHHLIARDNLPSRVFNNGIGILSR